MDCCRDDEGRVRYDPFDPAVHRDPYPLYRRLRDEDPVHHVEHRDYWVLSRFADVFAAAGDGATFSSAEGLTFERDEIARLGLAPTMVMMDRPDHTVYRRLVSRGFTPRQVAGLEPAVRSFVRQRVDALLDAGEGDFIELLAGPLPTLVVATYLGVPEEDRAQFDAWSAAIVSANARGDAVAGAAEAVGGLYRYFTDLVARRRREPADDMLSDLVAADVGGDPLDLLRILGYCFVMIAGGNDTVTGLLGGAAVALTERPDQRQMLVDDPGLIPAAVEELLRWTSPVQGLCRTTTQDVVVGGRTIPAGRKVHLLYGSANRDPREFGPSAGQLDLTRRAPRMMAFGGGPHHCLGAAAARLQGRVALEELLAAAPGLAADPENGRLAPGPFVRRYESLPVRVAS
ncbi:MAG TPA: cytochrome P450 [Acidimicrobiales bacterium]|nr:cytochrome P450 [Acidimicrobiales bacterium]